MDKYVGQELSMETLKGMVRSEGKGCGQWSTGDSSRRWSY